ncbi:unnamed protein product [Discosporangium mesarthrocarpum]
MSRYRYFRPEIIKSYNSNGIEVHEILEIEKQLKTTFPKAYFEFLELMGKSNSIFMGLDHSIHELTQYRGGLETILYQNFGDDGLGLLKSTDIVFLSSQGVTYYYISSIEGHNPPVYYACETHHELKRYKSHDSFTDFVMSKTK